MYIDNMLIGGKSIAVTHVDLQYNETDYLRDRQTHEQLRRFGKLNY